MDDVEYFSRLLERSCSHLINNMMQEERMKPGENSHKSLKKSSELFYAEKSSNDHRRTGTKRKRKPLSIEQKVEILEKLHDGGSVSELQKEYDVGQTTIYDLKRNRQKILNFYVECESNETSKRRMLEPQIIKLENHLYEWYCQCVSDKVAVSGLMMTERAKALHAELNIKKDCNYSKGWLGRFRKRHNIQVAQGGDLIPIVLHDNGCIPRKNVERLFNADNYKKSSVSRCTREEMKPISGDKRKHNFLSIHQKVEILTKLDDGVSVSVLAEEYDIGNLAIYELKANKLSILKFYLESDSDLEMVKLNTRHESENLDLDRALHDWYCHCRDEDTIVSRHMLTQKAKELHKEINVEIECEYSATWIHQFESRSGICHLAPTCETPLNINSPDNFKEFLDRNSFEPIIPNDTDKELLKIIEEAVCCITRAWSSFSSPVLKEALHNMCPNILTDDVELEKGSHGITNIIKYVINSNFLSKLNKQFFQNSLSHRDLISQTKDNCKQCCTEHREILTIQDAILTVRRLVNFLERESLLTQEEIVQLYQITNKLIKAKPKCTRRHLLKSSLGGLSAD